MTAAIARVDVPNDCEGRITGRVLPSNKGRVQLERKVQGDWYRVAADRLDRRSRFFLPAQGCGSYRVLFKGMVTNLPTTKALTLR